MWRRFTLILLLLNLYIAQIQAQTNGTLTVSVTTSSTGGNYEPRNILAIWVEDNSGKFVKTLLAYAATRKTHLNIWEASTTTAGSAFNAVDAISGATQSSHGTRTCSWNGTDYNGQKVPDGNYQLKMELTDKNATGNTASFSFTKGPNNQKLTPSNVPSFSSISINWNATLTGITSELINSNTILIFPNPGTGEYEVIGENIRDITLTSISGKVICKSKIPIFNISDQPNGFYFVSVKTDRFTTVKKIIKD